MVFSGCSSLIYNSRNFNGLAAEILPKKRNQIYNSRNFNGLAAMKKFTLWSDIYNSRNFNGLAAPCFQNALQTHNKIKMLRNQILDIF